MFIYSAIAVDVVVAPGAVASLQAVNEQYTCRL